VGRPGDGACRTRRAERAKGGCCRSRFHRRVVGGGQHRVEVVGGARPARSDRGRSGVRTAREDAGLFVFPVRPFGFRVRVRRSRIARASPARAAPERVGGRRRLLPGPHRSALSGGCVGRLVGRRCQRSDRRRGLGSVASAGSSGLIGAERCEQRKIHAARTGVALPRDPSLLSSSWTRIPRR